MAQPPWVLRSQAEPGNEDVLAKPSRGVSGVNFQVVVASESVTGVKLSLFPCSVLGNSLSPRGRGLGSGAGGYTPAFAPPHPDLLPQGEKGPGGLASGGKAGICS